MASSTSKDDGGSSSFEIIGSVGRSSSRTVSEMWTLLSRFRWYSANQARINFLFLISSPTVLRILSECCQAGMLSGPAVLLSLRHIIAFSTSLNDDGSLRFGMIGNVGRSSRKPGSEMWTLFSRFCRCSTKLAKINSLFFSSTPSVLRMLPECCQTGMLSGPTALLSLRKRMAFSTLTKDAGSHSFGMIGSVGRSPSKPGSEIWSLFSWLCCYSANQARINFLFLISTPTVLRTLSECYLAGMLSEPAVLLSLRQKMAFSTSSNDDGSSSFAMICSVGRSSRKSMLVMWTLLSRFCRYSANLARINYLFMIRHHQYFGCCQSWMLSGTVELLYLTLRMAISTS